MELRLSQGVFAVLCLLLIVAPLMLGSTRLWGQIVLWMLSVPLGLAMALRLGCGAERGLKLTLPEAAILVFAGFTLWHYWVAPSECLARTELLLVLLYGGAFWGASRHLPSARHAHALGWLVVLMAGGVAVYGIYQYTQGNAYIAWGVPRAEQYGLRAGGVFNCPNHFAGYLEIGLGVALGFLFLSRARWLPRLILVAAILAMLAGIGLSVSRGGWIATAGMVVFFAGVLMGVGRIPKWLPLLAVLVIAGAGWLTAQNNELIRSRFEQMVHSDEKGMSFTDIRLTLYRDALKIIEMKPWTGHGPATFEFMHPRVQDPQYSTRAVYTHGDYLNLIADYGIVGGGVAGIFLLGLLLSLWMMRTKVQSPMDSAMLAGGACALVVMLLHAVVEFNLHIPANALTLFAVVGAAMGLRREPVLAILLPRVCALGFAGVVLVGSLLVGVLAVRTGVGYALYYSAEKHRLQDNTVPLQELCERSLRWDPRQASAAILLGDFLRSATLSVPTVLERDELARRAVGYYERAHGANPWLIEPFNKMSLCYDIMDQPEEAMRMLREALRLEPYGRPVHRLIADHLWRWGFLEDARRQYEYVLSLHSGDEEARDNLNRLNAAIAAPRRPVSTVPGRVVDLPPKPSPAPPLPPKEAVPAEKPLLPENQPAPDKASEAAGGGLSLSPSTPVPPASGMSLEALEVVPLGP